MRGSVRLSLSGLLVLELFMFGQPGRAQARAEAASAPYIEDLGFQAREILEALADAWPDRLSRPERRGEDWAIKLDESWYLWAGGRLLPANFRGEAANYSPWPFYFYPDKVPPVVKLDEVAKRNLFAILSEKDEHPPRRYPAFYDQLWRSRNEREAWDRAKTLRFLGKEILVNADLLEEFTAIERDLRALALKQPEVAAWIKSISSIEGYVWRSVQGTSSRSMHSYGAAIDIVLHSPRSLAWYWLDARNSGLAWYELPATKRISVPVSAVAIFENYGFIWGGKWFYWDLVHFEYRPEILSLNGKKTRYQQALR